jgi:hypothetical protein
MSRRDFETHFSIDLLHKDQALTLAEGAARRVPLPGLAAIHQMTGIVRALGFGAEDISAQIKAVETIAAAIEPRPAVAATGSRAAFAATEPRPDRVKNR